MTPVQILVVEDERVIAKNLQRKLQHLGYDVPAIESSGGEAIRKAAEIRPDLVLMDIRLKGEMDGIEAAQRIRAQFHTPVIYLTAYADSDTLRRARETEPGGYLLKPFVEGELQAAIEMTLHRHRTEQRRADFVAMLAHDIRNPLSIIMGYAELLGDSAREQGNTSEEDIIGRLKGNAHVIHQLVDNYLQLAKDEAGCLTVRKVPTALQPVLVRIEQLYAEEARRQSIRIHLALPEELPLLLADATALERIFSNLVHNALKFTPPQGSITISVSLTGNDIVVTVADTGHGIPADELSTVFEKYRHARHTNQRTGVGLGLFIVKTLIQAHHGEITVESTVGEGTRFSVRLPIAAVSPTVSSPKRETVTE